MVNWFNTVAPADLIGIISDEKISALKSVDKYLRNFSTYCKARNNGITFSPSDINIEQLNVFDIIGEKLKGLEEEKHGR